MIWIWILFLLFVLAMLALDLGVFHHDAHVVGMKEALGWSGVWIALALLFGIFIYFGYEQHWFGLGNAIDPSDGLVNDGGRATIKYLTGYIVEKSLSVDNIFVIAMLFAYFAVPAVYQHRVLFWGILGALVMRGIMIAVGAVLIARFNWIIYVFGGFLILTAVKMLFLDTAHSDPGKNPVMRLARRFFPITDTYHGQHFFVRPESTGKLTMTPLALSLVMVETTDLIFAVDSIPAIFAITADPFLVFTSNVFAILGLRSLYFALAGMIHKFRYLKPALAVILAVVGIKMLVHAPLKDLLGPGFHFYILGLILLILAVGVIASIVADRNSRSRAQTIPN